MNKILVIGDAHVADNQNLSRFSLLGDLIMDRKPDHIVIMGDFLTLNCLSAWDKDKRKKMEGRRYEEEIKAGNKALDLLFGKMEKHNIKRRKLKKATYSPNIIYLEGNHEDRLNRYFDSDPTFEGVVSIQKDLHLNRRGIDWIGYREYYYINDIAFTHIPHNKTAPISGMDITRKAQNVLVKSCVFGHTHEGHWSNVHKEGQPHLQQTLNCGCMIGEKEDYVHGRVTNYWRGVMMLDSYKPGRFDFETYSLGRLERMYQ